MSACSFHGSYVAGPGLALLFAGVLAALLTPVGIGAAIGWSHGRRRGRRWRGLLQGVGWVLGAYLTLLAVWWASMLLERQQQAVRWRSEQALLDPVRAVEPGGWTALLDATRLTRRSPELQRRWFGAVLQRASLPEAWTAADLDALDRLTSTMTPPWQRAALRTILTLHREGDAGVARLRAACNTDTVCLRAIDVPLSTHDAALLSREQSSLWQATPAPPEVHAALERTLQRQREDASHWPSHGDARLAFERLQPGQLHAALEACNLPLTPSANPWNHAQQQCIERLFDGIRLHGAARLCPDAPPAEADLATLTRLQQRLAGEPRWLIDTVATARAQLDLACRTSGSHEAPAGPLR